MLQRGSATVAGATCVAVAALLLAIISAPAAAESTHTNNYVVIADTSRFWFNYRHVGNAMSVYRTVKRMGIPDSQIILMLADDAACNARNPYPGSVFNNADHNIDVYGDTVEVDYRNYDVTAENFVRVLTGRHKPNTPRSQRLLTDDRSNVFVYMTGHGGDEFIKFQDTEELSSAELADAFEQMWQKQRYNELLFIVDTCQAGTLFNRFYSPNIIAIGSSLLGENSYSHHGDHVLGLAIIDRFTYWLLDFCENLSVDSNVTLPQMLRIFTFSRLLSNVAVDASSLRRPLSDVRVTDFLGTRVPVLTAASDANLASGASGGSVRQLQL